MSDDPSRPPIDPLDEAGGRALVEAWRASGLSGAAYCRSRNLRAQRLHYWRERLGYPIKVLRTTHQPTTVPSSVVPSSGFVQVVVGPTSSTTDVEIVVGGAVIRVQAGFDPGMLRAVVSALGSQA
ncbi:MAG: hypothetical protein H0W72_04775 [Planctomycetes bacterium]|nr:hypothetical protein [Planctomycetota bacterium]